MARRMGTMWVAAVAAVALAACGAAVEPSRFEVSAPEPDQQAPSEDPEAEVRTPEPDQQGPSEDPEASEPDDDASGQDHDRGTDRDAPGGEARAADPRQQDDDGETPWHLLPEDDRPAPVEQPECDRARLTPVAC